MKTHRIVRVKGDLRQGFSSGVQGPPGGRKVVLLCGLRETFREKKTCKLIVLFILHFKNCLYYIILCIIYYNFISQSVLQ